MAKALTLGLLLFIFAVLCTGALGQEADPDDPVTWDADYVRLNQDAAFQRSMERAVQLVPELLANPPFAEQYFTRYPDRIFSSAMNELYAQHYLFVGRGGEKYRSIAKTYLSSGRMSYSQNDNRQIANAFFSSYPAEINALPREFERFMNAQEIEITIKGSVQGYAEQGVLTLQDGTTVLLHELKALYRFSVGQDNKLRLIPKRDPERGSAFPAKEFTVTGAISGSQDLRSPGFVLRRGTVDGIPLSDDAQVQLLVQQADGHKLIYATGVTQAGPLHFAPPIAVSVDAVEWIFKTIGARITKVDGPDPVKLVGERIDVSAMPPAQRSHFVVPQGYAAGFVTSGDAPGSQEGGSRPVAPIVVRGITGAGPVMVSANGGTLAKGVTLSSNGITAAGYGFAVRTSPAAFDPVATRHLLPSDPSDLYFRNGDVNLPIAEANKVRVIQTFLKSQQLYNCRDCQPDGRYGPLTTDAVAKWQQRYNGEHNLNKGDRGYLNPQGLWGPLSTAAMLEQYEVTIMPRGSFILTPQNTLQTVSIEDEATLTIRTRGAHPSTIATLDISNGQIRQRAGSALRTPLPLAVTVKPTAPTPPQRESPPPQQATVAYSLDGAVSTQRAGQSIEIAGSVDLADSLREGSSCAGFACTLTGSPPEDTWVLAGDHGPLLTERGELLYDNGRESLFDPNALQPKDLIFIHQPKSKFAKKAQRTSAADYPGGIAPTHTLAILGYKSHPKTGVIEPWVAHQVGDGRNDDKPRLKALKTEPLSAIIPSNRAQLIRVIRPDPAYQPLVLPTMYVAGEQKYLMYPTSRIPDRTAQIETAAAMARR